MEDPAAEKALEHFVIERKSYVIETVNQGYINDSYQILDGDTPVFLLQKINRNVFPEIKILMQNIQAVLPFLRGKNYHPLEFMPTKARIPFYRDDEGEYWRLLTFVPDSIAYYFSTEPKVAFEAGRILGLFHKFLANLAVDDFKEIIPGFHDLTSRGEEFRHALKLASRERLQSATKEIRFAEQTILELEQNKPAGLPLRICHNDTKLNNFLFSTKTGNALCLIDLDTVMPGYIHFDLGDAIRTLANPFPEDEIALEKISFDLRMVASFLEGIGESEVELSRVEKQAIPYGAVLMPFLHGLRALTDFLNNDIYYKVSYSDQNLHRSRSLFTVTQKALQQKEDLAKIVEDILGN